MTDSIYNPNVIEKKWQEKWEKNKSFVTKFDSSKPHFYNLWMFPYPSGEGLHAGHAFASTGSDIYGRFMRMNGAEVFQPIGYDSFGIHSENFAIKIGQTPQEMLARTTKHYEEQLRSLGHGYDWTRTVTTSDTDYYRWTQWIFAEMFKAGLAYKKKATVNYCPSCKTVLADEQVMSPQQAGKEPKDANGNPIKETEDLKVCERCGTVIEKKDLDQWFFRITDYADRLLTGLEKIDWSERVKIAQKEWIGKSKGLNIDFKLANHDLMITVWTKFWETIYGTTFLVVAPEYAQEKLLRLVPEANKKEVSNYIKRSLSKTEQQRKEDVKEKTGVFSGIYAVNPVSGKKVPVWIADYVLIGVGTGAVMGVPAHDERDYAFARKYKLAIRKVVDVQVETHSIVIKKSVKDSFKKEIEAQNWYITHYEDWGFGIVFPKGGESKYIKIVQSNILDGPWYVHTDGLLKEVIFKDEHFSIENENEKAKDYARKIGIPDAQLDWDDPDNYMFAHEKGGELINSGDFDGLDAWGEGKEKMALWMAKEGFANWQTTYHLRDWLVSRQRYWGPPIPMIYCEICAKVGRGWLGKNESKIHSDHSDWDSNGWWPEENLPVELPKIKEYQPLGTGKSPLGSHPEFYEVKCPECGSDATRETDVSDTFVDSSWYFLRYPSVRTESTDKLSFDPEVTKDWLPVSLYFGGAEHSVLHLMYARFVTMMLYDLKKLGFEEPFPKFFAHGLVIKDGAKMSKSRGNVVNPDEYIKKFGADTLRLYSMFMGPMDGYPDFRDTGIEGMQRFVKRVWKLFGRGKNLEDISRKEVYVKMHQTIKKITEDIQNFRYNTAIASLMEYVNTLEANGKDTQSLENLALLIAPFAPHIAEEVWHEVLGNNASINEANWPKSDPKYLETSEVEIIVQVNGKLRGQLVINKEHAGNEDKVVEIAKSDPKIAKWVNDESIKKVIFVPNKLLNFVV